MGPEINIITLIAITFGIVGFSFAGIAFWAIVYPKLSCSKVNPNLEGCNVCIRDRGHEGLHMTYDGREF